MSFVWRSWKGTAEEKAGGEWLAEGSSEGRTEVYSWAAMAFGAFKEQGEVWKTGRHWVIRSLLSAWRKGLVRTNGRSQAHPLAGLCERGAGTGCRLHFEATAPSAGSGDMGQQQE